LGFFSVPDPEVFKGFVALLAGGAALGGLSASTGEAVDRLIDFLTAGAPARPAGMPHHVLVAVTPAGVTVLAHSRHAATGKQAAFYPAQQFNAHPSRYLSSIDLTITAKDGSRLVLNGKRGPRHGIARTVRAVLSVAAVLDKPGRRQ
jgi:hypothetical protein